MNVLIILLLFTAGLASGWLLRKLPGISSGAGYGLNIMIYILLFLLGAGVGSNNEIIQNLHRYGLYAIIIAIGAIAGSILITWPLIKLLASSKESDEVKLHEK